MLFSRTYRYQSAKPISEIKSTLLGKHLTVHNLDFEVSEKAQMLRIIPHAENVDSVKTLPITHVDFAGRGDRTQVTISSKMRRIDRGGPMLVVVFCFFMIVAAAVAFLANRTEYGTYAYVLGGIGALIFIVFWMRMQSGYFDYVRKIRDYIKQQVVTA